VQIAVLTIIALIAVVAGRVVPFFMQRGIAVRPVSHKLIERLALPSILLFAGAIALGHDSLTITAALFAAVIHGLRLAGWFSRGILRAPMLWVLHVGYAWLVAGFLIYAVSLIMGLPVVQAVHAWTLGAIGMFTLGMMTRVALGHTGRNIVDLPQIKAAFVLMFLATLIRVMVPLIDSTLLKAAIMLSATGWMLAFIMVGMRYTFILLRAHLDGSPG